MAFNKEKVMDAARKFVDKGQIDKAVKEYLRIVHEDPKDVRVWLKIGDLYAKTDRQFTEVLAKRGLPTTDTHAGIRDTSELLYLEKPGQWIRKDKLAAAKESNGVRGAPTLASPEIGKLYLDLKVENAVKQIRSLVAGAKLETKPESKPDP